LASVMQKKCLIVFVKKLLELLRLSTDREEKRRHTGVRRQVKERGKETRSSDTVLLQQLQTLCEEEIRMKG